jgi:hypothetical protein
MSGFRVNHALALGPSFIEYLRRASLGMESMKCPYQN